MCEAYDCAGDEAAAGRLTSAQAQACYGPPLNVRTWDRAILGDVSFTCTRLETNKLARDSIVLMRTDGRFWAGKVVCFLSHAPPGLIVSPDGDVDIAQVQWFAHAAPDVEQAVMHSLGCPVVRTRVEDNLSGNLWPVSRLLPCKLAAVPHRSLTGHLVILSRFASFLQQLP